MKVKRITINKKEKKLKVLLKKIRKGKTQFSELTKSEKNDVIQELSKRL